MVDVTSFQVARKDHAYLAFPMGERFCELSERPHAYTPIILLNDCHCLLDMSPLVVNSKTKIELQPVPAPVHTFNTPIQQILSPPHTNDVGKGKMGK